MERHDSPRSGGVRAERQHSANVPSPLIAILKRHRLNEPFQGDLVFPNDRGEMYTKNGKLEDVLRNALARIEHPRIRLHDLRHAYASHFVMAGGNIYDLQKNLGHHSVAFTADVYGHLSADHRVKEADRLSFDIPEAPAVLPFKSIGL
jgi:integrase